MNRPKPTPHQPRIKTRSAAAILGISLLLVALVAGCGGKDPDEAEEQAQADRPHSMVPANLDSLIAETGTTLVSEEEVEESAGQLEVLEVTETVVAEEPAVQTAPAVQAQASTPAQGAFSLQVGSFRQQTNAATLAQKVQNLGYPATIEMAEVGGLMYHRVFVRGLADRTQAENLGEELRSGLGINYLVLRNQ